MIIDESHKNITDSADRDVISKINPKIIIKVSATPFKDSSDENVFYAKKGRGIAELIEVQRADVVAEGLIKSDLVFQTEEEIQLKTNQEKDLDEIMVELAISRRNQIAEEWQRLGKNKPKTKSVEIQPSVKKLLSANQLKQVFKKSIVKIQLDNSCEKQNELINEFENRIISKIQKITFIDDTVAKNPLVEEKIINANSEKTNSTISEFNIFFEEIITPQISTNVTSEQKEVMKDTLIEQITKIKAIASNKKESEIIIDEELKRDFLTRADYRDIGKASVFQNCFIKFMNEFFEIPLSSTLENNSKYLEKKGVELKTTLLQKILVNAIYHADEITQDDIEGKNIEAECSQNDVDKAFTWACYEILGEQTEEDARIGNRARSWGPFKESLRLWLSDYSLNDYKDGTDRIYRIFLNDITKQNSVLKQAITYSRKKNKPILNDFVKERITTELEKQKTVFTIKQHYYYTDDDEEYTPSTKSFVRPFLLKKQYHGRDNETDFINYLESSPEVINWFKNGDNGKEYFGIKYFSTSSNSRG